MIAEVGNREHLFADNIGATAYSPLHDVSLFKYRSINALRACTFKNAPCDLYQPTVRLRRNVERELRALWGQQIFRALRGFDHHNPSSIAPARQNPPVPDNWHAPPWPQNRGEGGPRTPGRRPPPSRSGYCLTLNGNPVERIAPTSTNSQLPPTGASLGTVSTIWLSVHDCTAAAGNT